MYNLRATSASTHSVTSVVERISEDENPGNSLIPITSGEKKRKPGTDLNVLQTDLRRCSPPELKEKPLKKPKTEEKEVLKEARNKEKGIFAAFPKGYKQMSKDELDVRMCLVNTELKIEAWNTGFWGLVLDKIRNSVRYLFRKRAHEIAGDAFIESDHVSIRPTKEHELLESIAQLEKTWASLRHEQPKEAIDKINNGNEIMMELLINVQKLQIIPNERLSLFLNRENKGEVILFYAINRTFQQPAPPLGFLNTDLKRSLEESPQMNEMKRILDLLSNDTWKSIQIAYSKAQKETKLKQLYQGFISILSE
ncbi:hypothetical protein PCASD_03409 [Puccinia coronata f. sp. avenae]|uniref:Uncharacterized protein n=1 Tax=Puccinia coronata f. sp. avenae TaxID=200324 RepID=A0A2N5VF88_9BASI|nr:hypothetical protein PCASD_03409 [Puccinia coronata f. sp. avenae]